MHPTVQSFQKEDHMNSMKPEVFLLLQLYMVHSPCTWHLKSCLQFWDIHYKKDLKTLGEFPEKGNKGGEESGTQV